MAVTNTQLLRHVANEYNTLEKNNLKEILDRGLMPVEKYHNEWSTENFIKAMEALFI